MVPGTYECPPGWSPEYSGWLMTEHYGHKGRQEFVCLDKDPETVPGEANNDDGALMYHVQGACNRGIPCPPYNGLKEMSCAVCTK